MDETISRRAVLTALTASAASAVLPVAFSLDFSAFAQIPAPAADKLADRFAPVNPGTVRLDGFLGERCRKNERARLLAKSEDELLAGFQQRPGKQAWVGEHVGKWLHAATLAWAYTHDAELKTKLDRVAAKLIATQQSDGYLGTYADGAHFVMGKEQQWDVWVHKYDLLGLLTYAAYTSNAAALNASRRIGDLLVKTFGAGGPLNLNERSTHVGMASGSVLEPMVLLYRATQDERYLDFARFIVERWETEGGPKLMSALAAANASVKATANGKAYEMLSCLVGLCELARATGESKYLVAPINAWRDITANQLLITGSGSSREHWTTNRDFLSNAKDNIAETCVTVTWLQLNQQLLRLTGEARYADELEKTVYNHLAAAQRPDGAAWDYFTALNGQKPYKTEQNCCTSSGPRGWALLPTFAYLTSADGIVINFFASGVAQLNVNGETVTVRQQTGYPVDGRVAITITVPKPMKFALRVRVPAWSGLYGVKAKAGDYWLLRQTWSRTQTIKLDFTLPVRVIDGQGSGAGQVAVVRGPQVLAVDQNYNPDLELNAVALISKQPQLRTSIAYRDPDGLPVYEVESIAVRDTGKFKVGDRVMLRLIPFASAGAGGRDFSVWLPRGNSSSSS